jgi:hypothetical protein
VFADAEACHIFPIKVYTLSGIDAQTRQMISPSREASIRRSKTPEL